jgi:ABC-type oligopeptide transport system substrate-binding subunit
MMNPGPVQQFRSDHGFLIMTKSPRLRVVLAITGYLFAAGLFSFAAQPPEVEDPNPKVKKKVGVEEEDKKGTVKKKVVVDDPDEPPVKPIAPKTPGGNKADARLDELDTAAAEAKSASVKQFLSSYAAPFDRVTEKSGTLRIKPIHLMWGKDIFPKGQAFPATPLDGTGKPLEPRQVAVADVNKIEAFEFVVLADVDAWLKKKAADDLTAEDQLAAAEKLLAAAGRFHDYAREHGVRKGKAWDDAKKPLADKLLEVRVKQLQRAVTAQEWQRARQFGTRLLLAYPKDSAIAKEVAVARVAEAELLMKSNNHSDRVKARELLDEFESRFPGSGGEPAKVIRRELNSEAQRLFELAKTQKSAGNAVAARNDLDRAEALDPLIPGLREMKREIGSGYPVLYVGARAFPERLSPATAQFDSEKHVVELLFEGLLEEVPDGSGGVRYRTGCAADFPLLLPGGRELALRQSPRNADGTGGLDAHDVVDTIKLMRLRPELPGSAGLRWLDDLPTPIGGGSLRISFKMGHPDPRSLLTFKVLPGRWLAEKGKKSDDREFSAMPFGTGPYRMTTPPGLPGNAPRELVLIDSSAYGRSRDRNGQPHLREIRFVELPKVLDLFDEFRRGRLHIIPDLSTAELKQALDQGGAALGGRGQVVTASTNRRVHVLAVNHRRVPQQRLDLRKGIGLAIDRDEILNELFMRGVPQQNRRFTSAMSGPFPPSSWATVKAAGGLPVPLVNRADAAVRLKRYLSAPGVKAEFDLAFSTGDPEAQAVCEKIKQHVESLLKDSPQKLTLKLQPLEPRELHRLVFGEHRYDFAYVPYDYPDDWHPFGLASMLDPTAAAPGGRNFNEYGAPGTGAQDADRILGAELAKLVEYRDFAGQILPRSHDIHRLFNDTMPFVPLWQLDRHMVVNNGLRVYVGDAVEPSPYHVLNPSVLFHNVGRWRME